MRVSADTKRQTRERILAAAGSLFASKGYGNTTTRDVAGEAGIATGTLFNYFPNKESQAMTLLASALDEARELWRGRRRGNESLEEDLFSHIATALRALAPHRLYVGEVFETAMSPFARSQVCREGDEVRVSHLEQVAALLSEHGRQLDGPSEVISIHLHGEQIITSALRLFYSGRLVYADPHPGNYLLLPDGRLGLLDFGCARHLRGTDWDYCVRADKAMRDVGLTLDPFIAESVELSDVSEMSAEHREFIASFCDWIWEPIRHEGPFDFSDQDYFERGAELMGTVFKKRYTRSKPMNNWLNRGFFGVRAMLHLLGARVDMKRINDVEASVLP